MKELIIHIYFMALLKYRCPVCSYIGKNEGELEEHIVERISGKNTQEYEGSLPDIMI